MGDRDADVVPRSVLEDNPDLSALAPTAATSPMITTPVIPMTTVNSLVNIERGTKSPSPIARPMTKVK
jgi:hypothetical protein